MIQCTSSRLFLAALLILLITSQAAKAQSDDPLTWGKEEAWKLSIHGHARSMVEAYRNINFGLDAVDDDAWLQQRLQAMFALEYRETFQIATELSWGDMWWRRTDLGPPDQDEGDFLQLYAQSLIRLDNSNSLLIRVGRQTLQYGSGRLLSKREGATQRLSHDAILLSWKHGKDIQLDAFIAAPVETRPGLFDNTSHPEATRLWALYAVMPSPWEKDTFYDVYYIG